MKNINRILEDNKLINSGCFTAKDIFKSQLNDKINNLDEDIKRQVLKRNKSFDKINSEVSEEFKLDKKDIEKYLIKSRSLGNLIIKNKNYNTNQFKLDGMTGEPKINQTTNDTITNTRFDISDNKPSILRGKNIADKHKSNLKSNYNTPNSLKKVTYDNIATLSPKNSRNMNEKNISPSLLKYNSDELNSSEIKKRNAESFLTRGGKISFFDIDNENNRNDYSHSFKKSKMINNNSNKKDERNIINEEINKLINKIREKNLGETQILSLYKKDQEKKIEQLKQEKIEMVEKKIKFLKEKKEKENQKMQNFRISRSRNLETQTLKTNSRQISIALPISPIYNENIYSSSKNNINKLTEPIITGKETKIKSLKHLLKDKDSSNILDKEDNEKQNLTQTNIKHNKTVNKFRSANRIVKKGSINKLKLKEVQENIRNKSRNNKITHFKTARSHLDKVKDDINELNQRKKNYFISYSSFKKNNKDYIMPVNDMDDVIQLNNVYTSLNENLSSINKTNN